LHTTSGAGTSIRSLPTLRKTDFIDLVSAVETKLTALLSSQPTASMLCSLFTAILVVPRGKVLASVGVKSVLFGTNFRLERIVPRQ